MHSLGKVANNSICASVDEIGIAFLLSLFSSYPRFSAPALSHLPFTSPIAGSYFGAAFTRDWETRERYNKSNQIQAIVSAVLYGILLVGGCVQVLFPLTSLTPRTKLFVSLSINST